MAHTTSANMHLIIPGVGTEAGPDYALDVNSSLTLIDQHDHSQGAGVQITPAGLNINAALTLNNNNLTFIQSLVFVNQTSISSVQTLYVKPGTESPAINDLWFNDGSGTPIQLTSAGTVNAVIASLPGESFDGTTFTWKQGSGSTTPANFDIGSITLRPNVAATTFGVQLAPPSAISSSFTISLPALPAAQSFLTIDNAGTMAAPITFANGITNANIASHTIGLNELATTVLQFNTQVVTTSGTFSVPANVTTLILEGAGGGGGGGSGAAQNGSGQSAGGGGSGGGGAMPKIYTMPVTPGETLTINIGTAGVGGAAVNIGNQGLPGTSGGATTVAGLVGTATFLGGDGGNGGSVTSTTGTGGSATSSQYSPSRETTAGGAGGNKGVVSGASAGTSAIFAAGGAAGAATTTGGGGGGGGGAGYEAGGAGAHGQNTSGAGAAATAGGISAGGGGGGGGAQNVSSSSKGANGGSGVVILYWLGAP